jgi:hypothetical protein
MDLPNFTKVEIVMVQPEAADHRKIAHIRATSNPAIQPVLYLVKVYLEKPLPATGSGYALYLGEERIPKYTEFPGGIYFDVHDPIILERHRGEPIRFRTDMQEFVKSTANLPAIPVSTLDASGQASLPTKSDALQK